MINEIYKEVVQRADMLFGKALLNFLDKENKEPFTRARLDELLHEYVSLKLYLRRRKKRDDVVWMGPPFALYSDAEMQYGIIREQIMSKRNAFHSYKKRLEAQNSSKIKMKNYWGQTRL